MDMIGRSVSFHYSKAAHVLRRHVTYVTHGIVRISWHSAISMEFDGRTGTFTRFGLFVATFGNIKICHFLEMIKISGAG